MSDSDEEKTISDAVKCVESFLESETGDYGHWDGYILEDIYSDGDCVNLYVNYVGTKKGVHLQVSEIDLKVLEDGEDAHNACKMEVCLYEDCYEEVKTYDWQIKYFWMALLSWD